MAPFGIYESKKMPSKIKNWSTNITHNITALQLKVAQYVVQADNVLWAYKAILILHSRKKNNQDTKSTIIYICFQLQTDQQIMFHW